MDMRPVRPDDVTTVIERAIGKRFEALIRVAAAIVGDRERALDVVHGAFARALRAAGRFRGDGSLEASVWSVVAPIANLGAMVEAID
jgi:DNA-directed RNA polymerase specialized sigma24 family protein